MKNYAIFIVFILLLPQALTDNFIVNGGSIQDAINSAKDGDTIFIKEGIYRENIIVNKSLKICGIGKVIIDGCGKNALKVKADSVIISNIEFCNSSETIVIFDGKNGLIEKSKIYRGRYGIIGNGTHIKECIIFECGGGILAKNNFLENCEIYKCGIGIELFQKNEILNCKIYNCGVGVYGENSSNNIIEKCKIYKCNNNQGEIFFINSFSNIIEDCDISYGSFGIRIVGSKEVEIKECKIIDSRYGFKIEESDEIKVYKCLIKSCRFGISIEKSKNISINYNDIIESEMYSLDSSYSYCDVRKNYWGKIFPNKFHKKFSIIKCIPWLLQPIYKENYSKEVHRKEEIKLNKINKKINFLKIETNDFDPLVDIKVGVKIKRIRFPKKERLEIFINGNRNSSIFYGDENPEIIFWQNVDDNKQFVDISFILGIKKFNIFYDLSTGGWFGDDFLGDEDGCGHIIFSKNEIYEIWFDIIYNDYDNDGLTYWEEENIYHTNPYVSDYGMDYDNDGIPIEWEDKYGYNPFLPENHSLIDDDNDGLNNLEEYYMRHKLSNPFAKDIFIEIDYMPQYKIYNESIQILYDAFSRHNITLHIEVNDELPYFDRIYYKEARDFYWKYFLNEDVNNPKHGIYHYVILVAYGPGARGGNAFVGFDNCDSILLACQYINDWRIGEKREIAYASLLMHELGHNLGLFEDDFGGIDNESCNAPWLIGYWKYGNYKSCMNYRYSFSLVDYSDGSNGINDFNDWDKIDLSFFKNSYYYE
ncbi:MAG: NosD domain-containing protein [Candidatus Thermoplasmatota archaeon]